MCTVCGCTVYRIKTICFNHFSLLMVPVQVSPSVPFLLFLFPRCYSFLQKNVACCYSSHGVESYGQFCPRPCSSTYRWARITIHAKGPHSMKSVLSRPLWPCSHRICVIAQRLGSLHKLAHAASNRSALKSGSKNAAPSPEALLSSVCFNVCFYAPPGKAASEV